MKLRAIIEDTLRSRLKANIVFLSLSLFFLVIIAIIALSTDIEGLFSQNQQSFLSETARREALVTIIRQTQAALASFVQFAALLLSVFVTAGILPSTLERGSIDILLSKPVSRDTIVAGRSIAAVLIAFVNTAFFIIPAWLIISAATGYWNAGLLATIGTVTVSFAVMYTAVLVLGILTRSSGATIAIVFCYLYIIEPVLANRGTIAKLLNTEALADGLSIFYYFLPKPDGIAAATASAIAGLDVQWMPIWTSALFAGSAYCLALWLFRRRDF